MKTTEDALEQALDAALDMTFPASDPIAVHRDERLRANSSQAVLEVSQLRYITYAGSASERPRRYIARSMLI